MDPVMLDKSRADARDDREYAAWQSARHRWCSAFTHRCWLESQFYGSTDNAVSVGAVHGRYRPTTTIPRRPLGTTPTFRRMRRLA